VNIWGAYTKQGVYYQGHYTGITFESSNWTQYTSDS